jgi:hypothetical protein
MGTLAGYIKHELASGESEYFALTNRYIVEDRKYKIVKPGLMDDKDKTIVMSSPQYLDHLTTQNNISQKAQDCEESAGSNDESFKFWSSAERAAKEYNIKLGTVYATSGIRNSDYFHEWLLIKVDPGLQGVDPENLNQVTSLPSIATHLVLLTNPSCPILTIYWT